MDLKIAQSSKLIVEKARKHSPDKKEKYSQTFH
jgi:hypothetical protein